MWFERVSMALCPEVSRASWTKTPEPPRCFSLARACAKVWAGDGGKAEGWSRREGGVGHPSYYGLLGTKLVELDSDKPLDHLI